MTNLSDERLSSLMDDELDENDRRLAIEALLKDGEQRARWGRYHLASDALHHTLPERIDPHFAARVMAAIEQEPTILAPPPPRREAEAPAEAQRPAAVAGMGKRFTGMAVAASVAMLAVLGVQVFHDNPPSGAPVVASVDSTPMPSNTLARLPQPPMSGVTLASVGSSSARRNQGHPPIDLQRIDPRLQKYLINHSQQVSRATLQGAMPYARLVAQPGVVLQRPVQR